MSHHVFGYVHRDELPTIVHGKRVPDEKGQNGGPARPGLDDLLLVLGVHRIHLREEVVVDKRPFFK